MGEETLKILTYEREPVPGTELLRQRVRVSFDFDIIVNDAPIANSRHDKDLKSHDIALIKQFFIADKANILSRLAYEAGIALGLNCCETFIETFLPQTNFSFDQFERRLLEPAIEQLEGASGEYWRNIRDADPDPQYSDWISICTENIFECFKAEFVSSSYQIMQENKMIDTIDTMACDVHIRRLKALQSIAEREFDQNGTSDFLLTIIQGIEREAKEMTQHLVKQEEQIV